MPWTCLPDKTALCIGQFHLIPLQGSPTKAGKKIIADHLVPLEGGNVLDASDERGDVTVVRLSTVRADVTRAVVERDVEEEIPNLVCPPVGVSCATPGLTCRTCRTCRTFEVSWIGAESVSDQLDKRVVYAPNLSKMLSQRILSSLMRLFL